ATEMLKPATHAIRRRSASCEMSAASVAATVATAGGKRMAQAKTGRNAMEECATRFGPTEKSIASASAKTLSATNARTPIRAADSVRAMADHGWTSSTMIAARYTIETYVQALRVISKKRVDPTPAVSCRS